MSCKSGIAAGGFAPLRPPTKPTASGIAAGGFAPLRPPTKPTASGIAVFQDNIRGTVRFTEMPDQKRVAIDVNVKGLKKNALHGFHVHEYGDLSDGCNSMCAHLNPYGETHGGPDSKHRHVGDLGNLKSDRHGCANYRFYDTMIKLRGSKSKHNWTWSDYPRRRRRLWFR
jgi:Cu/Zn superoxide dismutase